MNKEKAHLREAGALLLKERRTFRLGNHRDRLSRSRVVRSRRARGRVLDDFITDGRLLRKSVAGTCPGDGADTLQFALLLCPSNEALHAGVLDVLDGQVVAIFGGSFATTEGRAGRREADLLEVVPEADARELVHDGKTAAESSTQAGFPAHGECNPADVVGHARDILVQLCMALPIQVLELVDLVRTPVVGSDRRAITNRRQAGEVGDQPRTVAIDGVGTCQVHVCVRRGATGRQTETHRENGGNGDD